ncbi:MAG: hypothetical protein KAT00_01380 [Planctomycetes bacterium]|nr:hypothetical protein [Planctomycetota bacterium]
MFKGKILERRDFEPSVVMLSSGEVIERWVEECDCGDVCLTREKPTFYTGEFTCADCQACAEDEARQEREANARFCEQCGNIQPAVCKTRQQKWGSSKGWYCHTCGYHIEIGTLSISAAAARQMDRPREAVPFPGSKGEGFMTPIGTDYDEV